LDCGGNAQRDAAFLRANQVASLAKTAWRTLLGEPGVYGLASGKAASPLRFAAAVQIPPPPFGGRSIRDRPGFQKKFLQGMFNVGCFAPIKAIKAARAGAQSIALRVPGQGRRTRPKLKTQNSALKTL